MIWLANYYESKSISTRRGVNINLHQYYNYQSTILQISAIFITTIINLQQHIAPHIAPILPDHHGSTNTTQSMVTSPHSFRFGTLPFPSWNRRPLPTSHLLEDLPLSGAPKSEVF